MPHVFQVLTSSLATFLRLLLRYSTNAWTFTSSLEHNLSPSQARYVSIYPYVESLTHAAQAFYYDWLDRNAAKKGKPLPEKIGSMQYFLHGFTGTCSINVIYSVLTMHQDASEFLRKHPWPGRANSDTFDDSSHRQGGLGKKLFTAVKVVCWRTGEDDDLFDEEDREDERVLFDVTESQTDEPFYWSPALQDNFREELEK